MGSIRFSRRLRARKHVGRPQGSPRSHGQAIVEFVLVLVFVLVPLLLITIDFGRLFFGWVNLQNTARIAANYAANYPDAWAGT